MFICNYVYTEPFDANYRIVLFYGHPFIQYPRAINTTAAKRSGYSLRDKNVNTYGICGVSGTMRV